MKQHVVLFTSFGGSESATGAFLTYKLNEFNSKYLTLIVSDFNGGDSVKIEFPIDEWGDLVYLVQKSIEFDEDYQKARNFDNSLNRDTDEEEY